MILKRCENGHYYDGEIYRECPECRGMGQSSYGQAVGADYGDYADEDSVTVALPRSQGRAGVSGASRANGYMEDYSQDYGDDENVTVALPRHAAAPVPAPRHAAAPAQASRQTSAAAPAQASHPASASALHPASRPQQESRHVSGQVSAPHPVSASQAPRKSGLKPVVGWLVCVQGNDFGSSFTMKHGKNFIGRSADMDIVLHGDESIAWENHAAVFYVPKQRRFAIEPGMNGSRVYLNREAVIRPVWMKQHDILTIGSCSLMFFPCCGEHFSWEELIRRRRERSRNQ